jgi:hypothetical protein
VFDFFFFKSKDKFSLSYKGLKLDSSRNKCETLIEHYNESCI